jgi:hypothetical protein
MTTVTFDTHAAVERLMKQGVKKLHAEEFVKLLQESREVDFSNLVTKDYLDAKLNRTKYEVVIWLIACTIAIIGILKT